MNRSYLFAGTLIILTALVFWGALGHEFVGWDDPQTLWQNPLMNPPTFDGLKRIWSSAESGLYVPVTYTLWWQLAGIARVAGNSGVSSLNPAVFHSASIAVHAINAALAFALIRRLVRCDTAAFLGAALFALHPVQVEAVAWASGLKDLLGGMFSLIVILLLHGASLQGNRTHAASAIAGDDESHPVLKYCLALVAMCLGVLAKPGVVVAPVIAGILLVGFRRAAARQTLLMLVPFLTIAGACIVWARIVQPTFDATRTPLWTRPLIALDALSFYICKLFVPVNLAVIYGRTPREAVAAGWIYYTWLLPAIAAVIIWRLRMLGPWLVCGALVFVVALLPVLGLVRFMFQIHSTVADHYMYLAMVGPAIFLAGIMLRWPARLPRLACGIGVSAMAIASVVQLRYWRDSVTLFGRVVEINPRSATAHSNLGVALAARNRMPDAVTHFRAAVLISPENRLAHTNLAQAYLAAGDRELAAYHAKLAISIARRTEPEKLLDISWEQEILRRSGASENP